MVKKILTKVTQAVGKMRSIFADTKPKIVTGKALEVGDLVLNVDTSSPRVGQIGRVVFVGKTMVTVHYIKDNFTRDHGLDIEFRILERP